MKPWLGNIVIVAVTTAFGLGLSEAVLRVFTPFPINVEAANAVPHEILGHVMDPRFPGIDANGFRNESVVETVDIAALGDSMTFGYNAAESMTWPRQLARKVGKTVYNYGIGWYSILQYYYLMGQSLKLNPKTIILMLSLQSDLNEVCTLFNRLGYWRDWAHSRDIDISLCITGEISKTASRKQALPELGIGRWIKIFLKETALFSIIDFYIWDPFSHWLSRDSNLKGIVVNDALNSTIISRDHLRRDKKAMDLDRNEARFSLNLMKTLLEEMVHMARAKGVSFFVLFAPTKESIFHNYLKQKGFDLPVEYGEAVKRERALEEILGVFFDKLQVKTANPRQALIKQLTTTGNLFVFRDDPHPNATGYGIFADVAHRAFYGGK